MSAREAVTLDGNADPIVCGRDLSGSARTRLPQNTVLKAATDKRDGRRGEVRVEMKLE